MKTKYELKPIRDACTQEHRLGGTCRGVLNPHGATTGTMYACQTCGHDYTIDEAKVARANRDQRWERRKHWEAEAKAANRAKFTKTGDPEHDRRVDENIALNSQVRVNGVPIMVDAGQGGWESAMKAVIQIAAVMNSTPAPTDMKEAKTQ